MIRPSFQQTLFLAEGLALLSWALGFVYSGVLAGDEEPLQLPLEYQVPMSSPSSSGETKKDNEDKIDPAKDRKQAADQETFPISLREVEVGKDTNFKVFWRNGLQLQTGAEDFRVHIGGRFDPNWASFVTSQHLQFGPGGVGALQDGAEFRRARLRMDGTAYEIISWITEFDLATTFEDRITPPAITDMFFQISQLPVVGNFRVGHFREPFGLEALTGIPGLTFLERSMATDALVPLRNMGLMLFNSALEERLNWELGLFRTNSRNTGNPTDLGDKKFSLTGRLSGTPWYEDDGRYLLHLGAGFSHRGVNVEVAQEQVRFRAFPEVRVGRYIFADTGAIPGDTVDLANAEIGLNLGSFSLQGEYFLAQVNDALIGGQKRQPFFHGWYVQASYFLTREHRVYRRSVKDPTIGAFDRPPPFENFFLVWSGDQESGRTVVRGRGAWEVAVRFSWLDLNDPGQGVPGQVLRGVTFGLNWYLNNTTRIQGNYIIMDRQNPQTDNEGVAHIFATGFHFDF